MVASRAGWLLAGFGPAAGGLGWAGLSAEWARGSRCWTRRAAWLVAAAVRRRGLRQRTLQQLVAVHQVAGACPQYHDGKHRSRPCRHRAV